MSIGIVSRRYASALMEYASSKDAAEQTYAHAVVLTAAFPSIPNFRQILSDPSVLQHNKLEYLENIVGGVCGQVSPVMGSFISLLTKEKRSELFGDILLNYMDMYRLKHNIISVCLISAQPVDGNTRKRLETVVNPDGNHTVEWSEKIDPSIMGGFKLLLDDRLMDASVKTKLDKIKKLLIDNNNRIV